MEQAGNKAVCAERFRRTRQACRRPFLIAVWPRSRKIWCFKRLGGRGGPGSAHPGQAFAAADAEHAAFDPDGLRPKLDEIARIGLAVIRVVEPSRPLARAARAHRDENRDPTSGRLRRPGSAFFLSVHGWPVAGSSRGLRLEIVPHIASPHAWMRMAHPSLSSQTPSTLASAALGPAHATTANAPRRSR